jgi:beta-phosphoglucomutase-like phosphatase (HAD superfamily)
MKYKAIIFDMDGTIIDTEHIWKQARTEMITSRGVILTPELEHELEIRTHGIALNQSCAIIKELAMLPDEIPALVAEKSKRACELYATNVRFINGFLDFHKKVSDLNLKIGLATNADDQTVQVTNERLNLQILFGSHMYNITSVNFVGKPNPAIYLHAAQQLGVDPQECIAIEDSAGGLKAARAAGMFCIGINTSRRPELLKEADIIIEGYHEIDLGSLLE